MPTPGSLFANPAVGNTYLRIIKEAEAGGGGREAVLERARKVWSQGFVAEAIDRFYTHEEIMDVSGKRNKGLLRGDDMAKWQATIEAPLSYDYGRYTVFKAGPWAQSPVTLQQLALLKGFNLDGVDPTSRPTSSTPWSRRASSPSPTARRSTAIPSSSTCRCRPCCRTPTTPTAAS